MRTQHFIAAHTVTGEEQLQRLVEETGGRDTAEQFAQPLDRLSGRRIEGEAELRLETRRTQHTHRILAVTGLGIADQA